jgi:hypothetical protein
MQKFHRPSGNAAEGAVDSGAERDGEGDRADEEQDGAGKGMELRPLSTERFGQASWQPLAERPLAQAVRPTARLARGNELDLARPSLSGDPSR